MPSAIDAAGWRFDNSYTRLPPGLFTRSTPVPVQRPGLMQGTQCAGDLDRQREGFLGRHPQA